MNIYHQILVDNYRNPHAYGIIDPADFSMQRSNPSCGDLVSFSGIIINNQIHQIAFTGAGCVISLGSASLIAQRSEHAPISDILNITAADMQELIQLSLGPVRLQCALLPLHTLQEGIKAYIKKHS